MTWRRECATVLLLLLASTGTLSAQSILTDQILLMEPGLSASVFQEVSSQDCNGSAIYSYWCQGVLHDPGAEGGGIDALGGFYQVVRRQFPIGSDPFCDIGGGFTKIYEIERRTDSSVQVVARIPECVVLGGGEHHGTTPLNLTSDGVNGYLYLSVRAWRGAGGVNQYQNGIVRISGLPTLLDIILSYQPPSTLSFNVPVRPEGLPGADSFAMYAGDLATVSDLSQAAPLQCTVPAERAPVPGEQLTVPDTLPDPAVGDGRYYLAAVRHGAQIRAGRSSMGGVMQGRNGAVLPSCP